MDKIPGRDAFPTPTASSGSPVDAGLRAAAGKDVALPRRIPAWARDDPAMLPAEWPGRGRRGGAATPGPRPAICGGAGSHGL